MWLLPSAYIFATQAGGVGNDMIGAVFAAAALALALRTRQTSGARYAALSLLAVALCTGIKNVNLPILLPWLVAIWPMWRVVFQRPVPALVFTLAAALASCLPTTVLNLKYTGHWTGDPKDEHRVRQPSPVSGVVSNAVCLLTANTQPPIWPAANVVNERIMRAVKSSPLAEACSKSPRFEAKWYEMPSEEHAGFGPGIIGLGVISLVAALTSRGKCAAAIPRRWDLAAAGCLGLLVPVSLMSTDGLPRLIAPLCIPALLVCLLPIANESLTQMRMWRMAALLAAILPFPALLLSPARPLLPVGNALTKMVQRRPENAALARAARVYRIYDERADAFLPLKRFIPENARTMWLITFGDEPETSLWRPFGSLSVRHMLTLPAAIDRDSAVVISESILRERFDMSVEDFAKRYGLSLSGSVDLDLRASGAPGKWSVLVTPPE
jgi:hypothetical protein